jgi:hypothetical protein
VVEAQKDLLLSKGLRAASICLNAKNIISIFFVLFADAICISCIWFQFNYILLTLFFPLSEISGAPKRRVRH